ncbi:hypothetical protein M569_11244, partial [Genlisea aurea]
RELICNKLVLVGSTCIVFHFFSGAESAVVSQEAAIVDSHILVCCEEVILLYPLKSILQGNDKPLQELKLDKPCSWATIFKKDVNKSEAIILYQSGEIESRSLPELEVVGRTSLMSVLRWNFKNNMEKTMSASEKGLISLVNGHEFAFVSLLASENEFRILESSLPNQIGAAATTRKTKKQKAGISRFVNNMMKGLKRVKGDDNMDYAEAQEMLSQHLEVIFLRFPFSDPYDVDEAEVKIDEIEIDDEAPRRPHKGGKGDDEKERRRMQQVLEGEAEPRMRTREEIIAKYRKAEGTSASAWEAKEKLLERQEKLERLSRRTEELQSGAENFASMAQELAKAMEKKKWWNF